jgi:hypothetical protein
MSMRAVKALKMPDVAPAAVDDALPEFRLVDPASLMVDDAYQRNLSERGVSLIRRIVAEWDWRAFKPPVVVEVDGALHVLDGQHTAIAAASHPGIASIPVMVVAAGSHEDRASAFVRHNRDRVAVTATQLHHAMVAAGDEDAVTVDRTCERAGVRILKSPPSMGVFQPGDTMAVAALRALVNRRFAVGARKVLDVCVAAKLAPISADALKAVEEILFGQEYAGAVTPDALAETMRRMGDSARSEAAQFAAAHRSPIWKALVVVWFRNTRKVRRVA